MNQLEREQKEQQRLFQMKENEWSLFQQGYQLIAGIDEVGRGPLAGPVVAAAVILPEDFCILGVDDSKKLSEKKRDALYTQIIDNAMAYGIGIVSAEKIDEINILEATKLAMKQAVEGLTITPDYLLIDALELKDVSIPQKGIIKGDSISISIAAASIVAKVTRDRMMLEYHENYPHYGFDKNKGYGTKVHYAGLDQYGFCEIHRQSFLKKYLANQ